jgi:hypothetical protein
MQTSKKFQKLANHWRLPLIRLDVSHLLNVPFFIFMLCCFQRSSYSINTLEECLNLTNPSLEVLLYVS